MPPARLYCSSVALVFVTACGDAVGSSGTTGSASITTQVTGPAPTTSMAGDTGDTGGTTTDVSTSTSAVTDPTTGSGTTGSTGACVCSPGAPGGCDPNGQQLVCAGDCQGLVPQSCPSGQVCQGEACVAMVCVPGEKVCTNADAYEQCNALGAAYDPPVDCAADESCDLGDYIRLCLQAESMPSTIGCSFFGAHADNLINQQPDSIVIGNTSKTRTANVQLFFTPIGTVGEQPQGTPVAVAPGQTIAFPMTNPTFKQVSALRKGGAYRVQSDIPVIAYQHAPISGQASNDASMLLPEHALRQNHYIASWKDYQEVHPGYFNVIAVEDGTTVKWTPPEDMLGGDGVPAVSAGQTGQVVMNRADTLQVRVPYKGDPTGTYVTADKPIWVLGGAECVNIPNLQVFYCDHIQDQMLPLDYWGKKYVGAHSPARGTEKHYYRVFAAQDGTTITTEPQQPGTPIVLDAGQWKELAIAHGVSFMFTSDKPFMPVQYLESQTGGGVIGDPAMYQMIPVEQFLDRYAFVTGTGYDIHYVQITRVKAGPDVLVDGQVVGDFYPVGEYEVADQVIAEGAHLAESAAPFGIVGVGYRDATSYAYPGGLRLAVINPQ